MLGYSTSDEFLLHDTGPHHPERPDRLRAIWKAIAAANLDLLNLPPSPADRQWIQAVHPDPYVEHIRQSCQAAESLDADTPVVPKSFDAALLSAGALLTCCDAVMDGRVLHAFAAVRPPGHHAEPERPMGFCLFGNIAIAARYLQRRHGVEKVAIVDFDVHHGNGTQAAFWADGSVMFISLHQHPATCYPGTGYESEIGEGPGRGCIVNVPMMPGSGDAD
jgi:acetoin utilization deacetylase AcuC-like enzyme